jgi:hypothetical protein
LKKHNSSIFGEEEQGKKWTRMQQGTSKAALLAAYFSKEIIYTLP